MSMSEASIVLPGQLNKMVIKSEFYYKPKLSEGNQKNANVTSF